MSLPIEWSDEVQLRLHMTSDQINEQRERNLAHAGGMGSREQKKVERLFDSETERPWRGTVRAKSPIRSRRVHYANLATLLRKVARDKASKTARRFWNRQATKLEEKADEPVG